MSNDPFPKSDVNRSDGERAFHDAEAVLDSDQFVIRLEHLFIGQRVQRRLNRAGYEAWAVGGCVRAKTRAE